MVRNFSSRIIVVIIVLSVLVSVVVNYLYWEKPSSITEGDVVVGEGYDPVRNGSTEIGTYNGDIVTSPGVEDSTPISEYEEGLGDIIEAPRVSLVSEESLAKAWFDLRQGGYSEDNLNLFIDAMVEFLSTGSVPQIVDRFPLHLIDLTDFGFLQNVLRGPNGTNVNVITLVLPQSFNDDRVYTFFAVDSKTNPQVSVVKGLIVPTNFGVKSFGTEDYFFIGGEVLNEFLYTGKGSIGYYSVKVKDTSYELAEVFTSSEGLHGSKIHQVNDNLIRISSEDEGFLPFFYNQIENEGQTTDDLFLVTQDLNNSYLYILEVVGGKVGATLVNITEK